MTQRPIKFRAWDKQTKKLYHVEEVRFLSTNDDYGAEGGLPYSVEVQSDETKKDDQGYFITLAPDRFVLEQFTGLLDKNGKEIYEGDILKQYAKGRSRAVFKKIVCWQKVQRSVGFNVGAAQVQVIGNIHENPELLKVEPN